MTAKQIAILLAILLAISLIFNIKCDWGSYTPTTLVLDSDSISQADVQKGAIQISLCSVDSNNVASCSKDSIGMRGGSIELSKLAPLFADSNINCLSYSFLYDASAAPGTVESGLRVVFHGNHYDESTKVITYVSGPSYASDMTCPDNCPATRER